jgi:hypothetical protein
MKKLCVLASLLLAMTACDSSNYGGSPPVPPQATDFTGFVKDQFAATADDSDPVEVDEVDFTFDDQDDPAAFDDLLGNP